MCSLCRIKRNLAISSSQNCFIKIKTPCSYFYKIYSFVILYMSRHTGFIMASCSVFMLNILTFLLHPMFSCFAAFLSLPLRYSQEHKGEVEDVADV